MRKIALSAALAMLAAPGMADEYSSAMQSYLNAEISAWMNDPVIVQAIKAQNERTADFGQADIDRLDQTWRSEVGSGSSEIITEVLENTAAAFLRDQLNEAGGVISEIFVMDARGLNVAASDVTSDYWQGDEAKFQETFPVGADAVHLGEVEFDESSQTYHGQSSVAFIDPETNQPIGAMTVGVNAEALL